MTFRLKQTEFYEFKGINGVCCVANTVQEACEVLRIARAVMYARNKKMQSMGINDLADFKPTDWTGKIWISGREFDQNDKLKVRIDGEEKEMTALEIYEYLHE